MITVERWGRVKPGNGEMEGEGFRVSEPLRSFPATVRKVLFKPVGFFRDMPRADSLWNPLVFVLVCEGTSLLLTYVASLLFGTEGPGSLGYEEIFGDLGGQEIGALVLLVLYILLLAPLFILLSQYVGAALYHLLIAIIVGSDNAGFDATFRIYAYSSAVTLFVWIPFLGYLATLYGYYLVFLGIREAHGTTTGRAFGVVLVPLLFWVLVLIGLQGFARG